MNRHRELTPLIGTSKAIAGLREDIETVARSDAKVLITGESGSGKEVVARQIHAQSARAGKPFVAINCAGIPETLLESELFGHVKGSFTGAFRDKPGRLEMAAGGTVFLDEIGEMSLRMQGLLLRFLETGEIEKVGAERTTQIESVRVISATHRNLKERIAEGTFREDLYYRLDVITVLVPPLRDHAEDIPALVDAFLKKTVQNSPGAAGALPVVPMIAPKAMEALVAYWWPGNVRELENVVERMLVVSRGQAIEAKHLPSTVTAPYESHAVTVNLSAKKSVADELFDAMVKDGHPFWTAVYRKYMQREIARSDMRDLVHRGLLESKGNYRIVLGLFNMEPKDYKRFLNFLRKHDCRLPFKDYRKAS